LPRVYERFALKRRLSRGGPRVRRAGDRRQRMHAEAELRRLNAELEARVRARTAELRRVNLELGRSSRELSDAKAFLDDLVTASPSIMFRLDPRDLGVNYVSPNVGWLLGYSAEEFVGVPHLWQTSIHPDDRSRVIETLRSALDRQVVQLEQEYRMQSRDGRHRWVYGLTRIEYSDTGDPVAILWYALDIADRKAAERALLESQQMLQAVLDNSPAVIFIKNLDGRFVLINRRFETLFHTTRESIKGKTNHDVFPPVLADQYRDNDAKVVASGQALEVEEIAAQDDGVHVYFSSRFPLHDVGGKMYALCGIATDITARKLAEEEAKMARLEAEQANRAKSAFLSRMSHDLRTPLNAILGFAQLLETDTLSPDERECVSQILNAGEHLLGLINEVLDLARIEAGHLSLSSEPVSIADVVGGTLDLVRPIAARRRIALRIDDTVTPHLHVRADRQRLSQILLNLLSNAVKYNRDEGEVAVSCGAAGPDRIRICVRDTGLGIARHERDLVFKPFERLGAEQTGVEGTGLGLTVSRELAQAMGGALDFDSDVGQGCTFWVEMPRAAAPARAARTSQQDADARAENRDVTGTVVYVDDNRSNARLLERVLARRPAVRLIPAGLGAEGLALTRRERPGLVLLDLHLPDMHGEEVLRELRQDPRTGDIPVAILSADATPGQTDRLLAAGARAYLTKPLKVGDLLRLIDQTLGQAKARAERPAGRE